MAYEFKNMATLDVVETVADDATVLIEESGVIKRAPKSEVGGGSTEWDAVIEWKETDDESSLTLLSGDYNTIYNKIMVDGEIPNIMIKTTTQYGFIAHGIEKARKIVVSVNPDDSSDHIIVFERPETCMNCSDNDIFIMWTQDNTLEYY